MASTWLVPYAVHQKEMPPCTLGSSHRTLKDPEEAEWGPLCEQKGQTADLVEGTGNFRCCFWKDLQGQNHVSCARSLTHTHTHTHSLSPFFLPDREIFHRRKRIRSTEQNASNRLSLHQITCRDRHYREYTDPTGRHIGKQRADAAEKKVSSHLIYYVRGRCTIRRRSFERQPFFFFFFFWT
jgi:hypothetical protein